MRKIKSLLSRQNGQGMTEYIIIVALVAIAAIAAFSYFGGALRGQVGAMSKEIAGEDGSSSTKNAATAAGKAEEEGSKRKTLSNFTGNNKTGGN